MVKVKTRSALAVSVAGGCLVTAVAATSPVQGSVITEDSDVHASSTSVCGSLHADAAFRRDKRRLGVEHACEHLQDRLHAATRTKARSSLAPAHDAAVAALASTNPADIGEWSPAENPGTKTIGITSVLLHTGKVLMFGGKYKAADKNTAAFLYDPVTGTGHEVTAPAAIFCGSVTQLSNGRMLSVGGTNQVPKGIVDVWTFDPNTEQWARQPDSPLGRYYPTSTKLADGRVIITAGTQSDGSTKNPTVELYTPPSGTSDVGSLQVVGPNHVTAFYPRQWVMPDGNLLQVDGRKDYRLDTNTWQWTTLPGLPVGNGAGSSGLMLPGGPSGSSNVMMAGGLKSGNAVTSTELFNYANPSAGWKYGNPMLTPRSHMNLVQVPDGSAFGIGGNSSGLYDVGQPQTMAYNPANDTWTNMAVQSPRRGYHSTALLLPDGRIMSAGDTGAGGGKQLVDFYSPPYLFKGERPVITAAPNSVGWGSTFSIGASGPAVSRAVLMAPGATTHADEMNARHVELSVTATPTGFTATAPTTNVAPPGYYMLFVLTPDGVPSVARWVHVGP